LFIGKILFVIMFANINRRFG